jgi:hypothetical protein
MATTLATEKQSRAIKQRMAEIRTELPYSADAARDRVKQLADWKYHLSRHPVPIFTATLIAGYLLVPSGRSAHGPTATTNPPDSSGHPPVSCDHRTESPAPAKKGMLSGMMGAVATLALKHGASIAATHVSNALSRREIS